MKIKVFDRKLRRKRQVRGKIFGSASRPRIAVFRSNRYIYVQAINDENKITIESFSSLSLKKEKTTKKVSKIDQAKAVGLNLAEKLKEIKIKQAVFDRSSYHYHGRVAAVAEGMRKGGIKI